MDLIYIIIASLLLNIILLVIIITLKIIYRKNVNNEAKKLFKTWAEQILEKEKENIRKDLENILNEKYKIEMEKWKLEYSQKIREDAIKKSGDVLKGKVIEQIVPYFKNFPYDPRDARFLGSPIDFIIFDGLREKGKVEKIVFLEIKSGKSKLNENEKSIEEVIKDKKVEFKTIYIE